MPMVSANEDIVTLINRGYALKIEIEKDYAVKQQTGDYSESIDYLRYEELISQWMEEIIAKLTSIFPSELEVNLFRNPDIPLGAVRGVTIAEYKYNSMLRKCGHYIRGLETIRKTSLQQYTDLPIQDRLYVEDIDSFQKVRDVNPALVFGLLKNGFVRLSEDQVQRALEEILGVPFHKKDWGGEINDLYTANVVVAGARRATAFLLKGPGIGQKEMTIADCGKNGDQIIRLFTAPADLFVVQYVGPIADALITDVQGKVSALHVTGKKAHFLIIDGQDTARLLHAYGKL